MRRPNDIFRDLKKRFFSSSSKRQDLIDKVLSCKEAKLSTFFVPQEVAENENIIEPEDRKLALRFDYFIEDECVLDVFNKTAINALLFIFKRITSLTTRELPLSGLIRGNLNAAGERYKAYSSLFSKVFSRASEDVVIKEIEFLGDGRIFCFLDEERFQIVSIETKHRDTHNH